MEISDSERREVAENLRYAADYPGYEIRYMEQFIAELRETVFCDVCSDADYSDILQRIADLIDPTCFDTESKDSKSFACSACGFSESKLVVNPFTLSFLWVKPSYRYCPNCGARVVRGDE